jgi:predicted DNA-binding mobile mystery protein A
MNTVQIASADALDRQLPALQSAGQMLGQARPAVGWIRALRVALGMTATALAKRMHVSTATVLGYEKAEQSGSISISTLMRIAEALDADLVVAMVPRKNVQATLREKAGAIAREEIKAVTQTMRLEDQEVGAEDTKQQFELLVQDLMRTPRKLWR